MILLFDIGNSKTKIASVVNCEIIHIDTIDFVDLSAFLLNFKNNNNTKNIDQIWVAISHQTTNKDEISQCLMHYFNTKITIIESTERWRALKNAYRQPKTLGIDRWLGLIYAQHTNKKSCAIISCGTFITYDLLEKNGQHLGGFIISGLNQAKQNIQKLFNISTINFAKKPLSYHLGTDTKTAIEQGANLSFIATVNQLIAQNPVDYILLTGGDMSFVYQSLDTKNKAKITLIENMPLKGLLVIANCSDTA